MKRRHWTRRWPGWALIAAVAIVLFIALLALGVAVQSIAMH